MLGNGRLGVGSKWVNVEELSRGMGGMMERSICMVCVCVGARVGAVERL